MGLKPGNYLITGIAGSGKTTVTGELARRNFSAFSTDEMPTVTWFFDRLNGVFLPPNKKPTEEPDKTVDFDRYLWLWRPEGLRTLLARSPITFIGASVMNQYDPAVRSWFEKIFVLVIDQETLKNRIIERANNPDSSHTYGARPEELERILSLHKEREAAALRHNAIPIDARLPVEDVADSILLHVREEV